MEDFLHPMLNGGKTVRQQEADIAVTQGPADWAKQAVGAEQPLIWRNYETHSKHLDWTITCCLVIHRAGSGPV
jgi:hypothetical protein